MVMFYYIQINIHYWKKKPDTYKLKTTLWRSGGRRNVTLSASAANTNHTLLGRNPPVEDVDLKLWGSLSPGVTQNRRASMARQWSKNHGPSLVQAYDQKTCEKNQKALYITPKSHPPCSMHWIATAFVYSSAIVAVLWAGCGSPLSQSRRRSPSPQSSRERHKLYASEREREKENRSC